MSPAKRTKRLFQVAKEFNLGTSTIVEALNEYEFSVKDSPSASITPEMQEKLDEIFNEEKVKNRDQEKAREDYHNRVDEIRSSEKPSLGIDDLAPLDPMDDLVPLDDPAPEIELEPVDADLPEVIHSEKEEQKEEPHDKPESEEAPEALEPEPLEEETKTSEVVSDEDLGDEPAQTVDTAPEEEAPEPIADEQVDEPVIKSEEPSVAEEIPVQKSKEEGVSEVEEEPDEEEKEVPPTVIRARKKELKGTQVLGKITIPEKIKLPSKEAGEPRRKKKRKKKITDNRTTPRPDPKSTAPSTKVAADNKGKKKKDNRKEVKNEDVQSNIKQTLGRLKGGGSSTGKKRQKLRRQRREERAEEREIQDLMDQENAKIIEVTEFITVSDLAELFDIPPAQVIMACMNMGKMVSINQRLDADAIELIAVEFDREIKFVDAEEAVEIEMVEEEDDPKDLTERSPIVTIMGHVDHGKTSLLDYIKHTKVAAGEAGGITQHIGAYQVILDDGRQIAFLDTPGHEAFTAMRARGAQVTDIVILVVAADDSVMPQTIEAINHAQAAGVPIVVAINKMDKEAANPDKIKKQLSENNVLVEEWGGNVQATPVSAHTGEGIDTLLESVLVEAELMELKANPKRRGLGVIIEARVDKGKGTVANVLVQNGTAHVGDPFVAGQFSGRIRAMENELGERIEEAGPSSPVQITGFDGIPQAGDKFVIAPDERTAKDIATQRQQIRREQNLRKVKHMTLDDLSRRMALGEVAELNIIIKGDVDGSIEAISGALQKLSTQEVQVKVIHTGVGAITESDVLLASASDAIIIGFQVRPSAQARKLAEQEEIDIRLFSIIYDAVDQVRDAMEGLLSPELKEKILGSLEVRETFKVPGAGMIAGSYVTEGSINRNAKVRLIRDGIVIYDGELSSLKRFKDDVKEVKAGYECGVGIHNFNDIKVGDNIEGYEIYEVARKL